MNTFIHSSKLEDALKKFSVKLVKNIYRIKSRNYWSEPIKNCTPGRGFEMVVGRQNISFEEAMFAMNTQMNYPQFCEELLFIPYFYYHMMTDIHYYRFFMPAPNEQTLLGYFSDIEQLALLQ